jgi:hypothetical protein
MPNTHYVAVVETPEGCRVVPADTIAEIGDTVIITNLCGGAVTLDFPSARGQLWAAAWTNNPIADGGTSQAVVKAGASKGYYTYRCHCAVSDAHHAKGHSHPGMIVR